MDPHTPQTPNPTFPDSLTRTCGPINPDSLKEAHLRFYPLVEGLERLGSQFSSMDNSFVDLRPAMSTGLEPFTKPEKNMNTGVFDFRKVNILIYERKIENNVCAKLLEIIAYQILVNNGPTDLLRPQTQFLPGSLTSA